MKSNSLRNLFLSTGAFCLSLNYAFAGNWAQLSSEDRSTLQNGDPVVQTQKGGGSPWPSITIYKLVNSTPEEAAAVLHDYDLQPSYLGPKLQYSKSRVVNPSTSDVDYTVSDSFLGVSATENYTVRDQINESQGSYTISWKQLRADTNKKTEGYARFEPVGNETLIVYYSLTVPGRFGAGMFKDRAVESVKDAVVSIARQIEQERESNQALLQKQISSVRESF